LVIDPIFFYGVMLLLVPLGFGFTYMMIKLANEAERKSKLAKNTGPQKVATINLSDKWLNWLLVALLAFQVFLNIAAYNAALTGMKNVSLFLIGIILLVFAAFFHIYRYAISQQKNAPPPAPVRIVEDFPELSESEVIPEITGDSTSETSKLSDDGTSEEKPKELAPTVPTPTTKADLDIGNNNSNLGSQDLTKP
jgi:ubiquinol-cytochrome c reductase cytochrome b subunit